MSVSFQVAEKGHIAPFATPSPLWRQARRPVYFPVDTFETEREVVVIANLAGLPVKDVQHQLDGRKLTIQVQLADGGLKPCSTCSRTLCMPAVNGENVDSVWDGETFRLIVPKV